jgi:hypothetical protein
MSLYNEEEDSEEELRSQYYAKSRLFRRDRKNSKNNSKHSFESREAKDFSQDSIGFFLHWTSHQFALVFTLEDQVKQLKCCQDRYYETGDIVCIDEENEEFCYRINSSNVDVGSWFNVGWRYNYELKEKIERLFVSGMKRFLQINPFSSDLCIGLIKGGTSGHCKKEEKKTVLDTGFHMLIAELKRLRFFELVHLRLSHLIHSTHWSEFAKSTIDMNLLVSVYRATLIDISGLNRLNDDVIGHIMSYIRIPTAENLIDGLLNGRKSIYMYMVLFIHLGIFRSNTKNDILQLSKTVTCSKNKMYKNLGVMKRSGECNDYEDYQKENTAIQEIVHRKKDLPSQVYSFNQPLDEEPDLYDFTYRWPRSSLAKRKKLVSLRKMPVLKETLKNFGRMKKEEEAVF